MPSLCFPAAYEQFAAQKISWEEYLHHGLQHYVKGFIPHEGEFIINEKELNEKDPFGFALWSFQRQTLGVRDVSQLEAVFHAYSNGTVDDLKAKLEPLNKMTAKSMRKSLALLALRDRKLDVVQYVINDGQEDYDPNIGNTFTNMANDVDKDREPELFRIIQQSKWQRVQDERAREEELRKGRKCGAPPGTESAFDFW